MTTLPVQPLKNSLKEWKFILLFIIFLSLPVTLLLTTSRTSLVNRAAAPPKQPVPKTGDQATGCWGIDGKCESFCQFSEFSTIKDYGEECLESTSPLQCQPPSRTWYLLKGECDEEGKGECYSPLATLGTQRICPRYERFSFSDKACETPLPYRQCLIKSEHYSGKSSCRDFENVSHGAVPCEWLAGKTYTRYTCVNGACTLVAERGGDTCITDSDCQRPPTSRSLPIDYWKAEFYNGTNLDRFGNEPVYVVTDKNDPYNLSKDPLFLKFYRGTQKPVVNLSSNNNFSIRWSRAVEFTGNETYLFTLKKDEDDLVSITIGGQRVFDQATAQYTSTRLDKNTYQFTYTAPRSGLLDVVVEYADLTKLAWLELSWEPGYVPQSQ